MSRKNFSKAHGRMVYPGQVWVRPCGDTVASWRVLAVAEGYAMGRYNRAMPGVVAVEAMAEWTIAGPGATKLEGSSVNQ